MNAFYKILWKQLLICTFSPIQGIDGTNLKKDPEKLKLVSESGKILAIPKEGRNTGGLVRSDRFGLPGGRAHQALVDHLIRCCDASSTSSGDLMELLSWELWLKSKMYSIFLPFAAIVVDLCVAYIYFKVWSLLTVMFGPLMTNSFVKIFQNSNWTARLVVGWPHHLPDRSSPTFRHRLFPLLWLGQA